MELKKIFNQLNIFSICRQYYLPFWQCPHFIFLILSLLVIFSSILTYFLGNRFIQDPLLVALLVLLLVAVLFIFGFILIQGFEKLAEANRLKSEFVGIVSHQLRTPLSNFRWCLELMMSGRINPVSQKQLEYFQILRENSERMQELIKDLLIISKLETAGLPLKFSNFSLKELLESLVEEFRSYAKASNLEIELKINNSQLKNIKSDPEKLKIVVENLLDNAIRYSQKKGKVKILTEKRKENLYFQIDDEGIGIPKEDQKFIFQKFFRAKNATITQAGGTGLGLYISKEIIKKLKGKIGFKSQEQKGSTFWFSIPIKK
jgi:signal transduction histidine kinase